MDATSRGLRFYRASVREEQAGSLPVFVHGQIEPGLSDFDVIFRCLYERWKNLYLLSAHLQFDEISRAEILRYVQGGLVWANGKTSLLLHQARVLARRGRRMEEFDDNMLLLFFEPPPESLSWEEYSDICGYRNRAYPSSLVGVLHNLDGIYWEFYSSDTTAFDLLLSAHSGKAALDIYWVQFGADFPSPGNMPLVKA